jgi:two-component system, cell cycle sensor histidine kinase PleC
MMFAMTIQMKDHIAIQSNAVPLRLPLDADLNAANLSDAAADSLVMVEDADGDVARVDPWSIIRDLDRQLAITAAERDAARTALSHTIEQRSDFFAQLSHECRTPLNAILGYADLLQSLADNPMRTKRAAESIHEAGEHLLSMVEAVLDMAKVRAGTFDLSESDVSVNDICERAMRMCAGLALSRGVKIATRLPASLPLVRGDARVLSQILINLLSNAIKVSPEGTTVTLSATRASKGRLSLSVEDNGPGIPADALERIMQPFEQLDPLRDMKTGTGLGLSLVRAFAELHDGLFQIVSEVGVGTKMIIILPSSRVIKAARHGQQHEFRFTRSGA